MEPSKLIRHLAETYDRQYPLDLGRGNHLQEFIKFQLGQGNLVLDEAAVANLEPEVHQEVRRRLLKRWLTVHEYADRMQEFRCQEADVLLRGNSVRV